MDKGQERRREEDQGYSVQIGEVILSDDYIKLHRKLIEWEWYDNANTMRLFIHCLLKANWKSGSWHGIEYQPGQFITSLETLVKETGLTTQQVRTALNHLISTGEVTSSQQGKCRVITINKWSDYQGNNKEDNKKVTRKQQGCNKVVTTDEEYKEREEGKNIKNIYGEYKHVRLTQKQYDKLVDDYGEELLKAAIKYLDEYMQMKGKKYSDHNLVLRKWVFDAVKEKGLNNGSENKVISRTDEEQRNAEIDRYLESDEFKNDNDLPFV